MSNEKETRKVNKHPCLVYLCKNEGKHLFPKDEIRRAQWIQAIKQIQPGLTIRKYSQICSAHFTTNDFVRTPLSVLQPNLAAKILKKTAIPSIFPWTTTQKESEISSTPCTEPPSTSECPDSLNINITETQKTYSRCPPTAFVEEQPYFETECYEFIEDPLKCSEYIVSETHAETDNDQPTSEHVTNMEVDVEESHIVEERDTAENLQIVYCGECEKRLFGRKTLLDKSAQTQCCKKYEQSTQTKNHHSFSIYNYQNDDKKLHFYTGLESNKKIMFAFQTLGQNVDKLNYFYGSPPLHIQPLDQFFITLIILRRHKPYEEIAMLYDITIKQVSNIFITWILFMSLQWKNIDLWLDKESVRIYMPWDFYGKFPSTRVVLDATECPIKKPKLPFAQQVTYSSYKNRNTVKFIIGIAPSGLISYISPCYGGSATDRQIIERASIMTKFNYNDEIMVDKGLNVQDIFMPIGVKVNMPSFFKKGNQIGPSTLLLNRKVASKRVHVERMIGLLKTFKILTQPFNQTEIVIASNISFVCAMLVNFRSCIINKNA